MYKEEFDKLWSKTCDSVLYGISAKNIKGNKQLDDYMRKIVWNHTWGNSKLVPPERKLLDDIYKQSPQKAIEVEKAISNISVGNSGGIYIGIIIAIVGIIIMLAGSGMWKVLSGALVIIGVVIAIFASLQSNNNPRKAASAALAKVKKRCDNILS